MRADFFMCVFPFKFHSNIMGNCSMSTWMFVLLKICFLPGGSENSTQGFVSSRIICPRLYRQFHFFFFFLETQFQRFTPESSFTQLRNFVSSYFFKNSNRPTGPREGLEEQWHRREIGYSTIKVLACHSVVWGPATLCQKAQYHIYHTNLKMVLKEVLYVASSTFNFCAYKTFCSRLLVFQRNQSTWLT